MTRTKDILFITAIIVGGIGLGLLLNHFIPCKDYTTPLFIVLAIHLYLEDMFEKERRTMDCPALPFYIGRGAKKRKG